MDNEYELHRGVLKLYIEFGTSTSNCRFSYDTHNASIRAIIDQYELVSLVDSTKTFDIAVRVMGWIRDNVRYDGSTLIHPAYNARDLLAHGFRKPENVLNCRMLATVLSELLLGFGIPTRIVGIHSISPYDRDSHVVTLAWLPELNKWMMADPSFNAYYEDAKGMPLSPWELRSAMAEGNSIIAHVGAPFGPDDEDREGGLLRFFSKNLFTMHSPQHSTFGSETDLTDGQRWICLYPTGFDGRRMEMLQLQWQEAQWAQIDVPREFRDSLAKRRRQIHDGTFIYIDSLATFAAAPNEQTA
jgi:hypothetical protein